MTVLTSNGECFLYFHQSEIGVLHKKGHIKISQFTKFEVLSLDCNHVEGFQISEKLETLCGFGGRHRGDICMEFGRPLTGHSLVNKQ